MKSEFTNSFSSHQEINITPVYQVNTFQTPIDSSVSQKHHSSLPKDDNIQSNATINSYNSNNGYGLVNAGLAVNKAAAGGPYADAPKLGGNNWGADMINAPTAWQNGHTGQGIIVAVIDTGVDYNHQDLKNNIWTNTKEIAGNGIDDDGNGYIDDINGWNFESKNNNVLDDNGHGTHVSGTIAAENNGIGVTGIAYNSKIMAVKVLDEKGSGSYSNIAKGIRYAVDNGARVINLSLGGDSASNTLKSAIEYAGSKGVIVVMAAGNDGGSTPSYPARYADNLGIAVGAVDKNNQLADFSNRSGSQEIKYVTAPGKEIYSTVPNNKYAIYNGTSMAAPHVAGVVALMLSANPNLTESQVREIIINTAENGTSTQEPNPNQPLNPNPSTPSTPSLFPPLDSFFPVDMIDIGSQFPFDIGSLFPLDSQAQSTIQLPPVVLSVGEDSLELRFGNSAAKTPAAEELSYYSDQNKWILSYYDSNLTNYNIAEEADLINHS
jgi:subtilisin family serine protease